MDNELIDISTSLRLQIGYGIGHVLNDVCASLWFTYLIVFFHLVLEFSATQAGNLMLIGQISDALSTPFIGYHSDHTDNLVSAKYGKRKLWHLFGTACILASFPFIFSQCVGCSMTHKWAQMFYFSSFIVTFQIGWAAVQISHLSLIPELADDDHTRAHLTAVRYGFTVFSNLFVYIITWIVLRVTGECDKQQVGPGDAWKFRHIVYIVLSVGTVASILFHLSVTEKRTNRNQDQLIDYDNNTPVQTHCEFLKKPVLYQVAGVYMSTRLVVNVSQVLIPLYLHRTLGLAARSLAVIPLALYLGSLTAAGVQRLIPRSFTRKLNYLLGSACALSGFVWIYIESDDNYKIYYIYLVAVLIGFGGAIMLVTSLALTADLVGARTEASAFVYGLMSFTDKLACGIAIAIIQMYADGADSSYYRDVLSWVCGGSVIVGLTLTLLLPKYARDMVTVNDQRSTINTEDPTAASPSDIL
ncbi:major facilitator superfamily domain-containing protein 12-like isoform X1 [Galleria mellonella]|uniref:Major facilitator superfamily domain-containing protein 12-like isoform X1 n=2 Tax=Galleria mellonella TaxID=7137 RepID=A0A6J3CD27_GALME|nr:major facilitator superfamily domain-containing protein 12-like isoform X1 [Galleria mellonella]XP_031769013.2 major facilitator superfamily domain-containing protein 12-like isoform X1 [Galleria mellonella]XP_031769014.2 major facilitator superfamily domain-containing protein 12-like isoform X1 [Galleria mellonella]